MSGSERPQGMIWEVDEHRPTVEGLDAAGRPDPAYAAALGLVAAPLGRRALAAVIDAVIWFVLQLPLWLGAVPLLLKFLSGSVSLYGFVNHPDFQRSAILAAVTVVLSIATGVVQLVLQGVKGLTIGKALTGIRTVSVRTLERAGVGRVLLRFLLLCGANLVPLLGLVFLISPAFDPERRGRGWHDRATGVWLIDVRGGLNPLDEKRMRVARKMVKAEPVPERSTLPSLATPVGSSTPPTYQPGSRISAGVLGVARPHTAPERAEVAGPASPPVAPAVPQTAVPQTAVPQTAVPLAQPMTPVPQPVDRVAQPMASVPQPVAPAPHPVAPAPQPVAPAPQPVAPPPAPTPPPPAAPAPPRVAPAARVDASAPQRLAPATVPSFALRLDTGQTIPIEDPVLLGRNPDPAAHPDARPIPLADASKSLSKTHLLVRPTGGGFEIVDCGSTNGSGLIRDGVEYVAGAGVPVQVREGDSIRMGDRTASVVAR